jgi:hypothetical protein
VGGQHVALCQVVTFGGHTLLLFPCPKAPMAIMAKDDEMAGHDSDVDARAPSTA